MGGLGDAKLWASEPWGPPAWLLPPSEGCCTRLELGGVRPCGKCAGAARGVRRCAGAGASAHPRDPERERARRQGPSR